MSGGMDVVEMLARWTVGEPSEDERREDVIALLNEVVHLRAGRDEDTAQLAEFNLEIASLRGSLAAHTDMLNEARRKLREACDERDEACVELVRERADAVAALRRTSNHGPMGLSLVNLDGIADAIERGEHRREEEP